jgi:hypothetical protein
VCYILSRILRQPWKKGSGAILLFCSGHHTRLWHIYYSSDYVFEQQKAPNYDYKVKLAADQRQTAESAANKALAYHEKNPEKHPLYPEEWKKFWNRRYKEIQIGEICLL